MCGIVACRGHAPGRRALDALRQLEYRGYDSAGIAVSTGSQLIVQRAVGRLSNLMSRVENDGCLLADQAGAAIAHTRWATHGQVSIENAHPLLDCAGHVAVVHNGVLTNADCLRHELELAGHTVSAAVDSAVIAHLIEAELDTGTAPLEAVRKAVARLQGSWAIAVLIAGVDAVIVARHGSPLLVRGDADGYLVASDAWATNGVPGPLRALDDGDVAEFGRTWHWLDATGSHRLPAPIRERPATAIVARAVTATGASAGRQSAMATEIAEQPAIVSALVERVCGELDSNQGWSQLGVPLPHHVTLLGCGSSFYAAQVIARVLGRVAGVVATTAVASEYEPALSEPTDLVIAISQSGETADLLRATDARTAPLVAITNSPWSALARRADALVECDAGPELGVAATKSFTAQVIVGTRIAIAAALAARRTREALVALTELRSLPYQFRLSTAESRGPARELAAAAVDATGWLFLGCGSALPYAAEGALKLKEITYRWAQAYPAGELKHGPLALVEPGTPALVIDNGAPRLSIAVAEVRARGGRVVLVGGPHSELGPALRGSDPPWGPLACVSALQHLACELGVRLGRDVDRPRNLAKSVTVD
jgi:glucosamine--fructose-6-phosphate aminotransferase (isomerizing)